MAASEFAFLALGLVLGIASGSALVVVLGSRPPAREVKVTVGHDAVPRRAATLSSDAFTVHSEPARGGPADRRRMDRDAPDDDPPAAPPGMPELTGVPVMAAATALAMPVARPLDPLQVRTTVPSTRPAASPLVAAGTRVAPVLAAAGAISMDPERDPSLDALRIQAVLSAERAQHLAPLAATAVVDARPIPEPEAAPIGAVDQATDAAIVRDATPAFFRILRGDRGALFRTVAVLAGADVAMRRPWQAAITGLADAVSQRAIRHGLLDFPVGNPFWDTFTTEQCRIIAAALATAGYCFDGIDGWADDCVPGYRDLTMAVAAAGADPRRIRAWPSTDEIGALYREATVAADEYFAAQSCELELEEVQALAGSRSGDLDLLWRHWELARPVLVGPSASA